MLGGKEKKKVGRGGEPCMCILVRVYDLRRGGIEILISFVEHCLA